ncbi:MAG: right-handed parallel beta-helix repeat-containing protein [bacterium]
MKHLLLVACLVLLAVSQASARTWYIKPDGTGDAPTIQGGVDLASAGDTVLVAPGTYHDCTHRAYFTNELACVLMKSGICLMSETGDPESAIIDPQQQGQGLYCWRVDSGTSVVGFTIANGMSLYAGGMDCLYSSPTVSRCIFYNNHSWNFGGGMRCEGSPESMLIIDCVFSNNSASSMGGGISCHGGLPVLTNCTFLGNWGYHGGAIALIGCSAEIIGCSVFGNESYCPGGGVLCMGEYQPYLENTIIAFTKNGGAMAGDEWTSPMLRCCDLYGNSGGDWVGVIADQYEVNGNFTACPSFCGADIGDLRLCDESPCLPGHHPSGYDCGLIGAWGQGCSCGPSEVVPSTWGGIKAQFK